jgi:hypothetical protein
MVLFVVCDGLISGQENRSRKECILIILSLYNVVGQSLGPRNVQQALITLVVRVRRIKRFYIVEIL